MVIPEKRIFNLMDTNGRRSDVLNALKIYLEILEELREEYPAEEWDTYPNSTAQFLFYEKALEKSEDVFTRHKNYDEFKDKLGDGYQIFLDKDSGWIQNNLSEFEEMLDEAIEQRARHYTSSLVKMGFTNSKRGITDAGYSYLNGAVNRDAIEKFLPLDNVNIALLRQLCKLKIFSNIDTAGNRKFYSPFLMALVLLLDGEETDRADFEVIVQGLSPYSDEALKEAVRQNTIGTDELRTAVQDITVEVPEALLDKEDIDIDLFKAYFKSSKNSQATAEKYYRFFVTLKNFRENRSNENYEALLNCFDEDGAVLNKAFGYSKAVFDMGNRGSRHNLEAFLERNSEHRLLKADDYVREFYTVFTESKRADVIKEYSDTTVRLLSATGLFKFKNLPELSYRDILSLIFDVSELRTKIFGEMTEEEFREYEISENSFFGKCIPITEILEYPQEQVDTVIENIKNHLGVSTAGEVKCMLDSKKRDDFLDHIRRKYTKEKIMELLPLFSDRSNDSKIKKEVNDSASVPTIYEYIVAIAWFYISNEDFDLYSSLNLTLNADFEPVIHAGKGEGDIVIHYEEIIVMLEVTLMNRNAQKRGEWEPVLRHSLNLSAANAPKETITFFIADELDHNTINIWRAVAAAPLESTDTHKAVNGAVIMPFTNSQILSFLDKSVSNTEIIKEVKASFATVPKITDAKWQQDIMNSLIV